MILSFLSNLFGEFASTCIGWLPNSPFAEYFQIWGSLPYLNYINWLVPFGSALKVLASWIGCIALYYVASAVLRWVKVLGE